jgi:hypothetical protein
VVALNILRRDAGLLDLAGGLAARRQAQLLALFVEDLNLANLAGLPFATEVGRDSTAERRLDGPRLERAVRACSERIQQDLSRLNQRLSIEVCFKLARGPFLPTVFAEAGQVDILCFGYKAEAGSPARRAHGRRFAVPPVWTVYDGSAESEAALALAAEFAEAGADGLCVVVPARTAEEFDRLRLGALKLCPGGASPRFFPAEPTDGVRLLRRMRQTGCRLLVAARRDAEVVKAAAEAAEFPVVLV